LAQLLALKGAPGDADVRELTPEEIDRLKNEGYLLDDGDLVETIKPRKKWGELRLLG